MKKVLFAMVLIAGLSILTGCEMEKGEMWKVIPLNEGWKFRQAGQSEWLPATVPGTVHTDLLSAGKIADPFYRLNEHDVQWIDKVDWEYQTSFVADRALLGNEKIVLDFKGLDTYAGVSLNGNKLLDADNMFREWEVDIKPFLREGENILHILFLSPIAEGIKKYDANGFLIPVSGNDLADIGQVEGGKMVSVYTRKAGYHFGWDWGPRLVTSGIWRPVVIKAWDDASIRDIRYVQDKVTDEQADLTAVFELEGTEKQKAEIVVENEGVVLARKKIKLQPGVEKYPVGFSISSPKRWWSNGLGEPHLYNLTGKLIVEGRQQKVETRIGIRTLELVRDKDEKGTSFYFRLNGIPVFMKGANYIPNDVFLPRVTPENYRNVINTARNSNMNMLRIWGGGVYEDDLFYDLCDEAGILVWQDFMFACAMFPGDSAFLHNVRMEAVDNVKRLRNHPSVALWCGNNEILAAWTGWGWKKAEEAKNPENAAKIWQAYVDIFHKTLPGVVQEYDPSRSYWDSSPSSGTGIPADLVNGDEHYWGVWWGKQPFETYATHIARFMSEYGFQSFPEISTIRKYAIPEDYDIYSEVMKSHQRSSIGNGTIDYYLQKEYNKPKNFESFLYVNQVLQAEGIKFGLEGHRRAAPYCMGSLYWQINDVWPVASWSSTDYFQKWKALQYYAKKSFAPLLVSPYREGNEIRVNIINDLLTQQKGKMQLQVLDFEGNVIRKMDSEVSIPANSNKLIFSENLEKILAGSNPGKVVLEALFFVDGAVKSSNLLYLKPFKDLVLPDTEVEYSFAKAEGGYDISLSSAKLARNVYMQIGDEQGFFSDNYFDLLPGQEVKVHLQTAVPENRLKEVFLLRTLKDAF